MPVADSMPRLHPREDALRSLTHYLKEEEHLSAEDAAEEARELLRDATRVGTTVRELFFRPWWALALRGVLAIMAGGLFLARPIVAVTTLTLLFGAWAFADGVIALVLAITSRRSWYLALAGVVGTVIGGLVMWRPAEGMLVFYTLAATWFLARGVTEVAWGSRLGTHLGGGVARVWLSFVGLVSFLFGLLMLFSPGVGLVVLGAWIGAYAILFGLAFVGLGFALRRSQRLYGVRPA